jgi:mannose-6-phosphate isomerase-like protein (cupin superfamily)
VSSSTSEEKPWGFEIQWGGLFHGKEIHLRSGHRTSLKFHPDKNELLYVQHGEILAEIADERHFHNPNQEPARLVTLKKGDIVNVQAGCAYRLTAQDDSIVFEISDGYANPPIRLEDDYGRKVIKDKKYTFVHPKKT